MNAASHPTEKNLRHGPVPSYRTWFHLVFSPKPNPTPTNHYELSDFIYQIPPHQ